MNLSVSDPEDFESDEDHYPDCPFTLHSLGGCICNEIERRDRRAFAANVADWKNDEKRCY